MNGKDIEEMRLLAKSRGGMCLSDIYSGSTKKHLWECSEKHQWETAPSNIKQGKWCPKCGHARRGQNSRKYFIDDAQSLAALRGGKCLSENFKNIQSKISWKCSSGHVWSASMSNVLRNHWCPYCSRYTTERKCRYIIEQLTGFLFTKNHAVLEKYELDGYNDQLKLAFEYNGEQHYRQIKRFQKTEGDFISQKNRDREKIELCKEKNIRLLIIPYWSAQRGDLNFIKYINKRLPHSVNSSNVNMRKFYLFCTELNSLKEMATLRGGEILSTEYHNQDTRLKCQCSKKHKWTTAAANIKSGRWCPYCAQNVKCSLADMVELAALKGGWCLSATYLGANKKLRWKCQFDHIWEATPSSIKRTSWCPFCYNFKRAERKYQTEYLKGD